MKALRVVFFDLGSTLWRPRLASDWPDREPYPDTLPTLRILKAKGYRLAVVSDQPDGPDCHAMLAHWGMAPLFDAIALSCEVGCAKPDARLFRSALLALGVAPKEVVMVGDSLAADIAGAKALGMRAIWRRLPGQQPEGIQPDAVIEALEELPDILDQWQEE